MLACFSNDFAGSRYFCESFFGHPCPTSGKNYATAYAFGGPSRPASLVAYPTRGMQHRYRNDSTRFRKACIFTTQKLSVKTHALSLLGTTRLLSRSGRSCSASASLGSSAAFFGYPESGRQDRKKIAIRAITAVYVQHTLYNSSHGAIHPLD
jgi:hypothetical protein